MEANDTLNSPTLPGRAVFASSTCAERAQMCWWQVRQEPDNRKWQQQQMDKIVSAFCVREQPHAAVQISLLYASGTNAPANKLMPRVAATAAPSTLSVFLSTSTLFPLHSPQATSEAIYRGGICSEWISLDC